MKNYLLIIGILAFLTIDLTAQTLQWAHSFGGSNASGDNVKGIALDANKNVYTIGTFRGTVDFDPGAGVFNLTSTFGSAAIFILKLDQHGNFVWAKGFDSGSSNNGNAITLDAQGNIYVTGSFWGTVDFDPGVGVYNISNFGNKRDVFVLKLDANGDFVWAKQLGGTEEDVATAINVDFNGNVYTTGNFFGTADFDPGVGVSNLVASGSNDIFISKLDANGDFVYAKRIGGTNSDQGLSITSDMLGNIYTTGAFMGTVDFDPSATTYNLVSAGNFDLYVLKLDSVGNFTWAIRLGSNSSDEGTSILLGSENSIYLTGAFGGTVDFDPSASVFNLTASGVIDAFVSKLDSMGNLIWARGFGGTDAEGGYSLAKDLDENIYATGYFGLTADFDPSAGVFNMTSAGGEDVFITSLDSSGAFRFAKKIGSAGSDLGYDLIVDSDQNIYAVGRFVGTCDFDPSLATYNIGSAGGTDGYVFKLGTCPIIDPTITQTNNTLTSNAINATYQWIDCNNGNAPIAGETNQSYTPSVNGDYAVEISYGLCKDTSLCVVVLSGINVYNLAENTIIFPNPTSKMLTIKTTEKIEAIYIYNLLGNLVQSENQTSFSVEQLPVGVYLLEIKTANAVGTTRFVKE